MEKINQIVKNSIYKKISNIQNRNEEIKKDGTNKFQKYKLFSKDQVLKKLKPMLEEQKTTMIINDNEMSAEYVKNEKEYSFKSLKNIKLIDLEDTNSEINLNFWALEEVMLN